MKPNFKYLPPKLRRARAKKCGCINGALIMHGNAPSKAYVDIQRCDECRTWDTDEEAAIEVARLARIGQDCTNAVYDRR